jgi:hypothetical protein
MIREPEKLLTAREEITIRIELYGRSAPLPPLKQVVPDRYYYRGDHSHIICSRCSNRLGVDERRNLYGRCDACTEKSDKDNPFNPFVPDPGWAKRQEERVSWGLEEV